MNPDYLDFSKFENHKITKLDKLKEFLSVVLTVIGIIVTVIALMILMHWAIAPLRESHCKRDATELHFEYEFSKGDFISGYNCIYILPDGRRAFREDYRVIDNGNYIDLD